MNIGIGSVAIFNTYQSRLVVSDSFDRSDNNTSMSKTDNGLSWVPVIGTWGIAGGKATSISKVHNDIVSIPSTSKNFVLNCIVKGSLLNLTNFSMPSIVLKFIDASNFIQLTFNGGNSIALNKKDVDVFGTLATKSMTLQDNVDYKIRAEVTSSSIKIFIDGTLLIDHALSGADAAKFIPATKSALRLQRQGAPTIEATFDNLVIEELR